jgi:hypothetical protein
MIKKIMQYLETKASSIIFKREMSACAKPVTALAPLYKVFGICAHALAQVKLAQIRRSNALFYD